MNNCWNCGDDGPGLYCSKCGEKKTAPPARPLAVQPPLTPQNGPERHLGLQDAALPVNRMRSALHDVQDGSVTFTGAEKLVNTDERMLWNATPSPLTVVTLVGGWAVCILLAFILALVLHGGWGWIGFWLLIAVTNVGFRFLALRSSRYRASSQRLEVTDGLLYKQTRTHEVHHLDNAVINSPLLLSWFGLANVSIRHLHGAEDTRPALIRVFAPPPHDYIPAKITLFGVKSDEAVIVRDLLRQSGQVEAGRMDKFRVR